MKGIQTFSMAMVFFGGLTGLASAEPVPAETLTVAAGHSLKAAFQEILPMFEKEYGATVEVVYGPSQTLRREIEKGAPIDVFLPEAVDEVEKLHKKGLTVDGGPRIYAQTSLVLVTSVASQAIAISFHEVSNRPTRLAVGDPKTTALGGISARALAKLDPAYKHMSSVVYAEHSEDLINVVRTGQADVGLVYRADAIANGQVRIIDEAPSGEFTPVQFGEAVVWTCRKEMRHLADEFVDFMMSPRIQKLLLKYGFDPAPLSRS